MPPDAFYIRESFGKKKDWNSVVIWLMLAFFAVGPGWQEICKLVAP